MSLISGQHHSFDIAIAAKYGVEEAILIHHFMHWIRINQMAKRNIKEGHCWTYQSRKEMSLHFPYWNVDKIKYLCEKLEKMGVLVTGNFNKHKFDKTLWYAFANEVEFLVDLENSKKIYEGQKCPAKGKSALLEGKSAHTIPDSLSSDTKAKDKESGSASPPFSADAEALTEFFLEKLRERIPKFTEPNKKNWVKDMQALLSVDKRDSQSTRELIEWSTTHHWWKKGCQCPSKLRKSYADMMNQFQVENSENSAKSRIEHNREMTLKFLERYPFLESSCKIYKSSVCNSKNSKDISLSLDPQEFKEEFKNLFRREYELQGN